MVEPNFHLGFNKKTVHQRKISPEIERWDTPLSPRKELPRYIYIKNPAYMEGRGRMDIVTKLEITKEKEP